MLFQNCPDSIFVSHSRVHLIIVWFAMCVVSEPSRTFPIKLLFAVSVLFQNCPDHFIIVVSVVSKLSRSFDNYGFLCCCFSELSQ